MNLKGYFSSFIVVFVAIQTLDAQRLKLGLNSAPDISWISTNDITVKTSGAKLGYSMGVIADYLLKPRWSVELGSSLSLNQGGKIRYETGGNFWPLSELKFSKYNTGHKPLKDNTTLDYNLQFWSAHLGLKKHFREKQYSKMFLTLPSIHVMKLVNARGAIVQERTVATNEDIKNDLRIYNMAVSSNIGLEKRIRPNTSVYASLEYMRFLSDLTLNNGYKSNLITVGDIHDPKDDIYERYDERTRAILNSLSLKIGLIF